MAFREPDSAALTSLIRIAAPVTVLQLHIRSMMSNVIARALIVLSTCSSLTHSTLLASLRMDLHQTVATCEAIPYTSVRACYRIPANYQGMARDGLSSEWARTRCTRYIRTRHQSHASQRETSLSPPVPGKTGRKRRSRLAKPAAAILPRVALLRPGWLGRGQPAHLGPSRRFRT